MKINLGSVEINKETWLKLKKRGMNREAIKGAVIQAGLSELGEMLYQDELSIEAELRDYQRENERFWDDKF